MRLALYEVHSATPTQKVKSKISNLGEKISILPWDMAEQLAVENGEKLQKVPFLKIVFCNIAPLGDQKKRSHMKGKSKISNLGEKISILPWQIAEQLVVEKLKKVPFLKIIFCNIAPLGDKKKIVPHESSEQNKLFRWKNRILPFFRFF